MRSSAFVAKATAGARGCQDRQSSTCSAILRASSTSMPARCSRAWCARGVVAPREGSRSAVDLCGLRPPHGVGAETGGIESEPSDPTMDESRILTGRDVLKSADPTFEQERRTAFTTGEQRLDRRECLLGDPELNRTTRLLLDDGGSIPHAVSGTHIIDAQANERLHALSLLSMPRLNRARSRDEPGISSRTP